LLQRLRKLRSAVRVLLEGGEEGGEDEDEEEEDDLVIVNDPSVDARRARVKALLGQLVDELIR
jgi:hypothetical protein